eukprot:CAMPEP_0198584668 /NCGR_PEP_ID=MMETSP1462-20131121/128339_1 /TAXON_ID=1333877 /ORGANISM="Brandtodinium nutriculum, Strain RCC3387" /LENGTH=44 /DNA_ID= /DNA_START= /DNA_END= /DNA_ORIENTATION=
MATMVANTWNLIWFIFDCRWSSTISWLTPQATNLSSKAASQAAT